MSCKYCTRGMGGELTPLPHHKFSSEGEEKESMLTVYKNGDMCLLVFGEIFSHFGCETLKGYGAENNFKINYCPMCGEKLKEEE